MPMQSLRVESLSPDFSGVAVRAIDAPRPGSGQVLLRVDAASLNYPDLLMTRGEYQMKPPLPFTLGGDMAGEVLEVGDGVESLAVGQRVWGVGLGCFAEQAVLPEASVAPLPTSLDAVSGAAFGAAYLTAYVALVERARVQPGEWVLVHGAAGGMGLAAVDLAKALGAKVICTSTSDEKLARIAELYAPDAVVNLRDGFRERVLELTGGGADVIFDPVNGDVFDESIRSIAFNGRLLVVGFTSGEHRSLRSNIAMIKAFSLMGVRAGEYGRRFPDRRKRIGEALAALAAKGTIRPHVDAVYPLERWREAFVRMERRGSVGKIVLSLDGKER
jgi:NADPH2:quinone reductase